MPRLAVTLGDPRGIGPEIAARALAQPLDAEIVLVGA
jgi:4-hydroxy-L-threonine phosphate dehydrogenase PdxA